MSVANRKQQRIARALAASQGIPYQQAIRLILASAPQSTVVRPSLPALEIPWPESGIIPLGLTGRQSEGGCVVGISNADLASHMLVCGATGSGKSEMLKWLAFGVAKASFPLVVFDDRQGLSESLLRVLISYAPERVQDLVFCDLSNPQWAVAFNPLDVAGADEIPAVVAGVVGALRLPEDKPRAKELAGYALSALCGANFSIIDKANKCTLLDLPAFFTDVEFRRLVMEFCSDAEAREAFDPETGTFELYTDSQQEEHTRAIIRKLIPLRPPVAQAKPLSAPDNRLSFEKLVSERAIVVIKLASSWHERGQAELVGSLVWQQLLLELGRGHLQGLRAIVDDAPGIVGSGAGAVLKQAQRENVGIVVSCQYPNQFDRRTLPGLLTNTGSKVLLRLDAALSEDVVGHVGAGLVGAREIAQLSNYDFWANALVSDERGILKPSGPVRARCLSPLSDRLDEKEEELREVVLARSRNILGYPSSEVRDRKLARAHVKGDLGQMLIARADAE